MTATIKDVAAAAGVSIGTVSKVINKSGFVSDKIRERVLLAISLLNYKPNGIARSLKQSKTNVIGIVIDDMSNPYIMEVMKSIEDLANEMEYKLTFCSHNNDPIQEAKMIQLLIENRVDGIVMLPTGNEFFEISIPKSIPVILVDRRVKNAIYDRVVHENNNTTYSLIQHLYLHGYRKFCIVHGPFSNSIEEERFMAVERAFNLLGIHTSDQHFLEVRHDFKEICRSVKRFISDHGLTEAILATNHLALTGTIRALWDRNIDVPSEVAVVGFGDIDKFGILKPRFTFAKENPQEVGRIAAEILFDRIINENQEPPKEFLVTPKVIIGDSCGLH